MNPAVQIVLIICLTIVALTALLIFGCYTAEKANKGKDDE